MGKSSKPIERCPCGLGDSLSLCCGRYLDDGAPAPTAEALMRSRYTAYTLGDERYLLATWHPDTRPAELDLAGDAGKVKWLGLEVLRCEAGGLGDVHGVVGFVARFKFSGRAERLAETSRFEKLDDGRWYYRDGDVA
ncbi:YchJ family metal-binding protein [Crenobacter sp. SG2305]|uniref:YchJ family protein n=1 Tax=Crenobacter oryzisoli TaxID=3056844 RepID=UPI0025AA9A66|nr:YchJ family metal-binding protein [Crenobacter sp. SG2305]MDN0082633.1 YchJ family metal-binding protein [Crenobacter sp. SG2305]